MGTTQLAVYNETLAIVGERQLAALNEPRESRRVLDSVWTLVTGYCLSDAMWNFAMKFATATGTTAGAQFVFSNVFTKPTDLIHLFIASTAVTLDPPLVYDFADVGANWYANTSNLYLAYTSNTSPSYGMDLTTWTPAFEHYVAASLANFAGIRIAGGYNPDWRTREDKAYLAALNYDGVALLPGLMPFNAVARDDTAANSPQQAMRKLPFGRQLMVPGTPQPQQREAQ